MCVICAVGVIQRGRICQHLYARIIVYGLLSIKGNLQIDTGVYGSLEKLKVTAVLSAQVCMCTTIHKFSFMLFVLLVKTINTHYMVFISPAHILLTPCSSDPLKCLISTEFGGCTYYILPGCPDQ